MMVRNVLISASLVALVLLSELHRSSALTSVDAYAKKGRANAPKRADPNTPELMRLRQSPAKPLAAKLARTFGYEAKTYEVVTDDGYILTMIRIQPRRSYGYTKGSKGSTRPAVLLLPVLKTASAIWLGLGPGKAYALKLVEAGFDVWLGDFRGVPSSQKHKTLNPGSAEYWSFTLNEHGRHDIKAFVDKVRQETGQAQILVSTYCMGSTALLVYCHYHKNDCKEKIRGAVLMGSFLDLKSMRTSSFRNVLELLSKPRDPLFDRLDRLGYVLFSPEKVRTLPADIAQELFVYNQHPPSLTSLTMHDIEFSRTRPEVITRMWPEFVLPSSLEIFRFFANTWKTGIFGGLDYGKQINLKRYGSEKPAVYDLKSTSMPVYLIYSEADPVATIEHEYDLLVHLGYVLLIDTGSLENRKIGSGIARAPKQLIVKNLTHFEFIFSDSAAEQIYDPAIEWLKNLLRNEPKYKSFVQLATPERRASPTNPISVTLAQKFGYAVKTYHIVTADGYVVTLVRLGPKQSQLNLAENDHGSTRPAILVTSGIRTASGIFLGLGPNKSYALKLVDAGYDVWLGNFRGTSPSQEHLLLDPNSSGYWHFTPHEHYLDLTAFIDTVRRFTKQEKIFFSGYSTSSLPLFIYCHMDQVGCKQKIRAAFLVAPVLDLSSVTRESFLLDTFELLLANNDLLDELNYVQFPPEGTAGLPMHFLRFVETAFANPPSNKTLTLLGVRPEVRKEVISRVWSEVVSPRALDDYRFMMNTWKTGIFQALNWGEKENLKRYNQKKAPVYDLKRTTIPVYLIHSAADQLETSKEAEKIALALPNLARIDEVPNLNHWDFFLSDRAVHVYDKIIGFMNSVTRRDNEVAHIQGIHGIPLVGYPFNQHPAYFAQQRAHAAGRQRNDMHKRRAHAFSPYPSAHQPSFLFNWA